MIMNKLFPPIKKLIIGKEGSGSKYFIFYRGDKKGSFTYLINFLSKEFSHFIFRGPVFLTSTINTGKRYSLEIASII